MTMDTQVPGSSPLTRGKLREVGLPLGGRGLIPAHAGKTGAGGRGCPPSRAHPRSRGENAAEETAVDIHLGSSPLTRGKRDVREGAHRIVGLIPAHAGKTEGSAEVAVTR